MSNQVPATQPTQTDTHSSPWAPLPVLQVVLEELEQRNICFCHWKSNYHLEYALTGVEDVDVLIAAADFSSFVQVLSAQEFKQADSVTNRMQPGVFHFLGNDSDTGTLINIHAYTRILTGDHFLKSWALPLESMLLSETEAVNGMRLPLKSSELIVFVFRNMIKLTTLFDFYLSTRSTQATAEEFEWLTTNLDIEQSLQKLEQFFPEIPRSDFEQAIDLLASGGSLYRKLRLGQRFKQNLKKYRRYGPAAQSILSVVAVGRMVINRLARKQKHMHFLTGGKIIALVGPQATGKSTLATALKSWLGQELAIASIHAGKPPATWLTFLPNKMLPLAKTLLPGYTTVKIETQAEDENFSNFPLIFLLRKVILAHDRRRLLRSVYQQSRNGRLIISDRYPSDVVGAIDGATFKDETIERESSSLKRMLMRWERNIYRKICPPDLVLQLTVPLGEAVVRNQTRDKKGGQTTEYVRARHSMQLLPEFHHSPVIQLSTDRDFDEMLIEVKQEVWKHL